MRGGGTVHEEGSAMGRLVRAGAAAIAIALVAVACGGGSSAPPSEGPHGSVDPASITGTIRLLSYSDGFDPGYLAPFEQQYPNIHIETSSMGSNEEAIAK